MENQKIDWDVLPLVLRVADVASVLDVNKAAVYALCHRRDFPLVKVGRNFRVPKDGLRQWLERQSAK